MSINLRQIGETEIIYFIISKRHPPHNLFFEIPQEFSDNGVLSFLMNLPENLLQLGTGVDFFEASVAMELIRPIRLFIVYDDNLEEFKAIYSELKGLKVICLDSEILSLDEKIDLFAEPSSLEFYIFYNGSVDSNILELLPNDRIIQNPSNFISLIEKNKDLIISEFPYLKKHSFKPKVWMKEYNPFYYFRPTFGNYYTLNQLTNHHWLNEDENVDADEKEESILSEKSGQAIKNKETFDRQGLILSQIKRIDQLTFLCYKEKLAKNIHQVEPLLAPLILTYPFHNPQIKTIFSENSFLRYKTRGINIQKLIKELQSEQTTNYVNDLDLDILDEIGGKEVFLPLQKIYAEKLSFLDQVSYLHSSFWNSPIFRVPFSGRSLNRELSFFSPKTFPALSRDHNRKRVLKTIKMLGQKLSKNRLSPQFLDYLKNRNGQIIAISDLPIEWLTIDEIPICFTHDICRLPETPLAGILSHYTKNNAIEMTIDNDIYGKILVIYGSNEPAFLKWRNIVEDYKKELGFNTVYCDTVDHVIASIKKFTPDILIFDCHGGVDDSDLSTYLDINGEKLTNKIITENRISAPIVFLSACGTAPNYGFFNSVAQGFFEAGAITVTTTFLPIDVDTGSILYLRLLHKLRDAIKFNIHKNWLDYIAHVVRTSAVFEAMHDISKKQNFKENEEQYKKTTSEAVTDLLYFNKRRKVYLEMDKRLSKIDSNSKNLFRNQIPEYLFYSHLGRPDLIFFENWLKAKRELNSNDDSEIV